VSQSPPDKDQRTIAPSPRRIAEFRRRGEVALSRDLTSLLTMAFGVGAGAIAAPHMFERFGQIMAATFERLDGPLVPALSGAAMAFASLSLPVAVGALFGFIVAAGLQLGWPPVLRGPRFELGKLFSFASIMEVISPKAALGRVLKSTLRVAVVGAAGAFTAMNELRRFFAEPVLEAAALAMRIGEATLRLGIATGLTLLVFAVFDLVVARRRLLARMKMTPEEAKREHREQEGDPMIRRRRKQRMAELARRRTSSAVKTADVVLVNPTEYAVALRYAAGKDRAPRVVAKGRLVQAEHIRTLARQAGIPIVAQPPLCRLIHKLVPEGREIPAKLYQAVAEVLAYVYRLKQRRAA
jgi:flagellar biosynthesis protein FlhB